MIINLLVAIIIAAVTLWLLALAVPVWLAALIALLVFFLCLRGDVGSRFP